MKQGRILKGVGGYYTVCDEQGILHTLKARGRFRKEDRTPLPGDWVCFEPPHAGMEGAMGELLPRRNCLLRPRVANVDLVFAVLCAQNPAPDFLLLDKLCVNAHENQIEVCAVLNKADLATEEQRARFQADYAPFHPLCISTRTGEGREALLQKVAGKVACLAGQSGVGKTSLVNLLLPGTQWQTGELSAKTSRGRHTTRHAELLLMENGGTLVDTPGFSLMELPLMEPLALADAYPEFAEYRGCCKFTGCLHDAEPGCAVKQAVEQGYISTARWQRYTQLLKHVQEKWRNRYE